MAKIDEVKARIDWLKELFKIVVAVMVADVAGMAKLYLETKPLTCCFMAVVFC